MVEEKRWADVLAQVDEALASKQAELAAAVEAYEAAVSRRDEVQARVQQLSSMRNALTDLLSPVQPWEDTL